MEDGAAENHVTIRVTRLPSRKKGKKMKRNKNSGKIFREILINAWECYN